MYDSELWNMFFHHILARGHCYNVLDFTTFVRHTIILERTPATSQIPGYCQSSRSLPWYETCLLGPATDIPPNALISLRCGLWRFFHSIYVHVFQRKLHTIVRLHFAKCDALSLQLLQKCSSRAGIEVTHGLHLRGSARQLRSISIHSLTLVPRTTSLGQRVTPNPFCPC